MVTETDVGNAYRQLVSAQGVRVFRNNAGALKDARGRLVRYGLGNENPEFLKSLKPSDYIGWTPVVIRPEDVGRTLAVFTSVEAKTTHRPDSRFLPQMAWLRLVQESGGFGRFIYPGDVGL